MGREGLIVSLFDSTSDELTYAQALVEIANRVSWPSEEHWREVVRAVQKEKGILPPEPDAEEEPATPADLRLRELRKQKAERDRDEEIARLERELAPSSAADDAAELRRVPLSQFPGPDPVRGVR